jgi:hypothetical protein
VPIADPVTCAGEQALALIEAQRVHAEPGPFGHLPDGQALCWLGHGAQNR